MVEDPGLEVVASYGYGSDTTTLWAATRPDQPTSTSSSQREWWRVGTLPSKPGCGLGAWDWLSERKVGLQPEGSSGEFLPSATALDHELW